MALARLCGTFFLLVYLVIARGQQHDLSNIAAGLCLNNIAGSAQQISQRRAALLSESKNCNQNLNRNQEAIALQQLQNNQAGMLQGNLQANNQLMSCQQRANLQQTINTQPALSLQQPTTNQNQQICVNQNVQLPVARSIQNLVGNQNPQKRQHCVANQSQQIFADPSCQPFQSLQQDVNFQPQFIQQQQSSTLLNNSPISLGQSVLPHSDINLASMVNRQLAGLPSQVSQGTLLSHLGLQSNLPTFLPNSCGSKQSANQATLVQNNCPNNVQSDATVAMINKPQTYVLPLSMASQQIRKDSVSINPTISTLQTTNQNPPIQPQEQLIQNPQLNTISAHNQFTQFIPMQQQFVPLQNQPALIPAQYQPIIGPFQSQTIPSSVQEQSVISSVQSQPIQNQPRASPIQSAELVTTVPCQSRPQVQNQLIYSSVPVHNDPMLQTQLSPVPTSQCPQSPNGIPQYPNKLPDIQNNGGNSKSSSMKQLLPLLLNLLKEKSCCGCRQHQNCGCMNNNNPMFPNQPPQVIEGYAQYIKNVPAVVHTAANMIDSEEEDDDDAVWRLEKYRNYNESKTRQDESAETDEDDDDSIEDVKDNEE